MNRSGPPAEWDFTGGSGGGGDRHHRSSESDFLSEFFVGEAEEAESSGIEKDTAGIGTSTAEGKEVEEVYGRRQKRKRNRTTEMHNLTERKRRDRIKEKLKALRELIPNSHKLDRAALLDQAITYMKSLQLQVQIMSGGGHGQTPCVSSSCLHMPHFNPFSHFGMGYGMRMPNMACPAHPALSTPPLPATSLVHMPGLSTMSTFGVPLATHPMTFAPLPEYATGVATPATPCPPFPIGPFSSSYQVDARPQEAEKMKNSDMTGLSATTS